MREQANARISVIFDFYNALCKNGVVNDVLEWEQKVNGGRISDISPETLTEPEKNVLLSNPAYAVGYIDAADEAELLVNSIFNSDEGEKKENAFKHAIWNAFTISNILNSAPASENQAIDFTQDGTSAHEKQNDGSLNKNLAAGMDLHNNMSARVWMEKEVKWGIGPFRKMPSKQKIIDTMLQKANAANYYNSVAGILNLHGGDNQTIWNNLYNNMYGAYEHLVYTRN